MRTKCRCGVIFALALSVHALMALDSPPYENIVHPTLNWQLSGNAKLNGDLLTVVSASPTGGATATATVDLTPYDGIPLVMEIEIAGTNIAATSVGYLGLKFMLYYTDPDTQVQYWPQATKKEGTFEKQKFRFTEYSTEGRRSKTGTLTLGFQTTSGTAVFDLSTLQFATATKIWPQCPWAPRTNEDYVVSYPASVTNAPQLRGVMLPSADCTEDDFATLQQWGATIARYQMTSAPSFDTNKTDEANLATYNAWLAHKLDHLDSDVLPWAVKYGLRIVIDIHDPPGGRYRGATSDNTFRVQEEELFKNRFVEIWREIATRFKGRAGVYGYDIYNEPTQTRETKWDYWTLQRIVAEEIRKIDPATPIIVESAGMDAPEAYSYLSPLAMDNVIYQVHCYSPGGFTHQGVNTNTQTNRYPDADQGWNRDYIASVLAPVRKFEKKHNAKIYVGEFSAINWAEGSADYIADCISIFNEYGWDWSFHAFREWAGWSVEHVWPRGGSPVASADNPRKRALLAGMRSNDSKAATAQITGEDTFEEFDISLTPIQLHRGWSGDGSIVAETYEAPTPPGFPIPNASHTRVLAIEDDSAEKEIASTNGANQIIDFMVRVKRTAQLFDPDDDVRLALSIDGDGRFVIWHMKAEAAGWSVLSPQTFADGEWVRVSFESVAAPSSNVFYHRVRINGSLQPTDAGVASPEEPTPFGPWYRSALATTNAISVFGAANVHIDDVRVTSSSLEPSHTGPTKTNGVDFAWFDRWGFARRPDEASRTISGYTLSDVFRAGVNPLGDEQLLLKGVNFEEGVELLFNGYQGENADSRYEVLGAETLEELLASPTVVPGVYTGDAATWSTTWRGTPAEGLKFFYLRCKE